MPLQVSRGNTPVAPQVAELSGEQVMGVGLRYSSNDLAWATALSRRLTAANRHAHTSRREGLGVRPGDGETDAVRRRIEGTVTTALGLLERLSSPEPDRSISLVRAGLGEGFRLLASGMPGL